MKVTQRFFFSFFSFLQLMLSNLVCTILVHVSSIFVAVFVAFWVIFAFVHVPLFTVSMQRED